MPVFEIKSLDRTRRISAVKSIQKWFREQKTDKNQKYEGFHDYQNHFLDQNSTQFKLKTRLRIPQLMKESASEKRIDKTSALIQTWWKMNTDKRHFTQRIDYQFNNLPQQNINMASNILKEIESAKNIDKWKNELILKDLKTNTESNKDVIHFKSHLINRRLAHLTQSKERALKLKKKIFDHDFNFQLTKKNNQQSNLKTERENNFLHANTDLKERQLEKKSKMSSYIGKDFEKQIERLSMDKKFEENQNVILVQTAVRGLLTWLTLKKSVIQMTQNIKNILQNEQNSMLHMIFPNKEYNGNSEMNNSNIKYLNSYSHMIIPEEDLKASLDKSKKYRFEDEYLIPNISTISTHLSASSSDDYNLFNFDPFSIELQSSNLNFRMTKEMAVIIIQCWWKTIQNKKTVQIHKCSTIMKYV